MIYFPETGLPSSCNNPGSPGVPAGFVPTYASANKTPSNQSGEAEPLQSPLPSALPAQKAESKDLFVPAESADGEPEKAVPQESDSPAAVDLDNGVKAESPAPNSDLNVQTETNDDLSKPISLDSEDRSNSENDDLPIPSDPLLPAESDFSSRSQSTPSITVGDYENPADETPAEEQPQEESEQPEQTEQTLPFIPSNESEESEEIKQAETAKKTTEEDWDAVFDELLPVNPDKVQIPSQNPAEKEAEDGSAQTDSSDSNSAFSLNDAHSEPGAVSIPPSGSKPVEQRTRTSGVNPSPNPEIQPTSYFQPAQGEEPPVPVEVAPLKESSVFIPAENCAVADNNPPTDAWGFNIPSSGYITVRRLPNAINSTEPKYLESLTAYQPQ